MPITALPAAIAACSPAFGDGVPLGPNVRTVPPPDAYRGNVQDVAARFTRDVQAAIADLQRHGIRPAALLVDTLFTSDGVFADPAGFLHGAVDAIHAAGGLFIADEVQAGFARSGSHFWGFQRHGVVPDIITMGKPMGNGHPLAGLMARADIIDCFGRQVRYFNTFGGNPVSVAAGMAVLDVIEREGLQQNARDTGAYLKAGFEALADKHALIGDVRGAGFFIGVEMVSDRDSKAPASAQTTRIVNALRERRILISATGPAGNILKVRPQLPFGRDHADMLLGALDEVLAGCDAIIQYWLSCSMRRAVYCRLSSLSSATVITTPWANTGLSRRLSVVPGSISTASRAPRSQASRAVSCQCTTGPYYWPGRRGSAPAGAIPVRHWRSGNGKPGRVAACHAWPVQSVCAAVPAGCNARAR
jgi:hypothetical protein